MTTQHCKHATDAAIITSELDGEHLTLRGGVTVYWPRVLNTPAERALFDSQEIYWRADDGPVRVRWREHTSHRENAVGLTESQYYQVGEPACKTKFAGYED